MRELIAKIQDTSNKFTTLYQQKMSTYTDNYKWRSHTSIKHGEISWQDAGCQSALKGTCQKKREELGLKYKKI